jgi:hypothetical protein
MKKNLLTTNKRLLAYSAMAAALVTNSDQVMADIVYVDIPDATLELGDFGTLDLDGDGVVDFGFILESDTPDWTFIYGFGNLSALSYGNPSNQFVGYSGAILPYGSALATGDLISPDLNFLTSSGGYNLGFFASVYSGVTYGQFGDASDHFIGVKFDIGGAIHYGWIRVNCTVSPVSMTIKDWAYDDEADTPIPAGATLTPLPVANFSGDAIIESETATSTTVTVQLDIPGDCSVDIDVNDALTTATNGADFTMSDPTAVSFVGRVTTVFFDITLTDDAEFEGSESIILDITNPVGCEIGASSQYAIIINDDEVPLPPLVSMDGLTASAEESAGAGAIDITISETADCVVDYNIGAGTTATEGSDFTYTTGSVTFTDGGALTQSFDYNIIDDADVETAETIIFEITGVSGTCEIGLTPTSTVNITDNDVAPVIGEVAFDEVSGTVDEADITFTGTVNISEAADCEVTLNVNEAASTATNGEDFTFSSTVLTFTEGGATSLDFDLDINEDIDVETDETVVIEITSIDGNCTLDAGSDALNVVIVNEDVVSIDEFAANGITLYSFNNEVYINLTELNANTNMFQLLDASGRVVFNAQIISLQNKFTLTELPAGVYVARLTGNGASLDKQIYLNK